MRIYLRRWMTSAGTWQALDRHKRLDTYVADRARKTRLFLQTFNEGKSRKKERGRERDNFSAEHRHYATITTGF